MRVSYNRIRAIEHIRIIGNKKTRFEKILTYPYKPGGPNETGYEKI